jgi:hypothetical protein
VKPSHRPKRPSRDECRGIGTVLVVACGVMLQAACGSESDEAPAHDARPAGNSGTGSGRGGSGVDAAHLGGGAGDASAGANGSAGMMGNAGTGGSADASGGTNGTSGSDASSGKDGTAGTQGVDANCPTPTHTIYLNRSGGTYTPGVENARANTSSIVSARSTVSAYSAATWPTIAACARRKLARYDVAVLETDPGQVPHVEIVVSDGTAVQLGLSAGILSAAPFTCSPIPEGIGFVLTGSSGTPEFICDLIAFTTGSLNGAEPTTDPCDLMSYSTNCPTQRTFVDALSSCGTSSVAPCQCGGTTQNSHRKMLNALGAACDADGPG